MPAILITPPVLEPVSLADMKAHLAIGTTEHDATLARLITAARTHVEATTRRVLLAQTWRVTLDRWPRTRQVLLPIAPVSSITQIAAFDALGGSSIVPNSAYRCDATRVPALLTVGPGAPQPGRETAGIEITLVAGHGAAATDVPAPLREAVLRLAARWFEHRLDPDATRTPPPIVEALIAPYRVRL